MARRSGLSERRYSNYVTGRREPDLATLVRIAAVLQTTPDRLLLHGAKVETAPVPIAQQRIHAALRVLSPDDLERLAVVVEALAAKQGRGRSTEFLEMP